MKYIYLLNIAIGIAICGWVNGGIDEIVITSGVLGGLGGVWIGQKILRGGKR